MAAKFTHTKFNPQFVNYLKMLKLKSSLIGKT